MSSQLENESADASITRDLPVLKRLWKHSSSKLRIRDFSIKLGSNVASAVFISMGDWLTPAAFLKFFDQLAGPVSIKNVLKITKNHLSF